MEAVGGGRGQSPEQPAQSVQVTPRPSVQDAFRHLIPVEVDLATLKSKFDMRLSDAAKSLGISITSFKQVCRKLGVARWPRRLRPRSSAQQPGSNSDSDSELIESESPRPRDGGPSAAGGSRKRSAETDINPRSLRVGESGLKESFLPPADPSIHRNRSDGGVGVSPKTAMHQMTQPWTLQHSVTGQAAQSTAMTKQRWTSFAQETSTGGSAIEGLHQVLRPSAEVLPSSHRGLQDLSRQSVGSILRHDSFDTRSATRSTFDMQCAQSPHNFLAYGLKNLSQQSAESILRHESFESLDMRCSADTAAAPAPRKNLAHAQRGAGLAGLSAEIEATELHLASLRDLQEYIAFPSLDSLMKDSEKK